MAGTIGQYVEHHRGDLAELRRMDPDEPDAAAFWKLMAQYGLLDVGEAVERKWALIIHGIALTTSTCSGEANRVTAHNGQMPVGRALFLGGESRRATGFYSEARLNRLLTADGPMLRTLLARMFRMLTASGVSFNWREMAQFILNEGYDDDAAEQSRRRIAREYYRAERRSNKSNSESE
ncbi:MAG: type I-E CRISPR-associated protein Cse2/CasB [Gammaproteobacteria bacterium]|nr:type I-E CRISPR-associated protein Cse2/CasB [Gammaproteobacteria bacterium]